MYRIISASKDTYITDKYVEGTRVKTSNVGQAGTLDLFKLYNETSLPGVTSSIVEQTGILIKFDYDKITDLTSSILNFNDSSFKCFLSLKDVYGGQTTPSNFSVSVFPLSKSFDEGRGSDVASFKDIDGANFLSASLTPLVTWSQEGALASGSNGEDVDFITDFSSEFEFSRGDEDLLVEVTELVSASLAGIIPNNGFKIQFSDNELYDANTYFVKRFGSRHVFNKFLKPSLIIKYDDRILDDSGDVKFDISQSLFVYNKDGDVFRNFFSGSNEITGTDSLILEMVASKSVEYLTSSFSVSHNMNINYVTKSLNFFTASFTGSQYQIGDNFQTGIYKADFYLDTFSDELKDFLSGSQKQNFEIKWKSLDNTHVFANSFTQANKELGSAFNDNIENIIVNIINLKNIYKQSEKAVLRVIAFDYDAMLPTHKFPTSLQSKTIKDLRWSIKEAFSGKIIIPFDESTRMSYDRNGMYFDLFLNDLDINEVYEIELLITEENNKTSLIKNQGFRFKVIK